MIKKYLYLNAVRNFSIAMVWINGGSDMDEKGKKGINHILCSLLSRGCDGLNNLELSEYVDYYGAELNQEISEDGILISLKSLDEYFDKLYPLIDLIINRPLLELKQFKHVKKSTLNAIKKSKENPFNIAYEKWRKLVYVDHPYAFNSIGYAEDILRMTHDDILNEYEKFKDRDKYLVSNNELIKGSNEKFVNFDNHKKNHLKKFSVESNNTFVSTPHNSNQVILMMGNQTCPQQSYEYIPLKILESYLSYGMSSKLFKLFREKNGLSYEVGVHNPLRKKNSPYLIYLSVSNKNAILAFKLLLELWKNLLKTKLSEKEINLAKDKLRSSYLINNQSLDEILQRRSQLIGYNMDPNFEENFLSKIDTVNSEDIFKTTNKFFTKPCISVYGDPIVCNKIQDIWNMNF